MSGLTQEQIDDVARELQAMVLRGENERARAWMRRIRGDTGAMATLHRLRSKPTAPPGCSACGAPLAGERWCGEHAPAFLRPPEHPRQPKAIDRAREAVLAQPGATIIDVAFVAQVSEGTASLARKQLRSEGVMR